jgi:hypothetical protein
VVSVANRNVEAVLRADRRANGRCAAIVSDRRRDDPVRHRGVIVVDGPAGLVRRPAHGSSSMVRFALRARHNLRT